MTKGISVRQPVSGPSYDALVAGLSKALLHVSSELARDLGALPVAAR